MRIAVDLTPIRPDGSAGGVTYVAIELLKAVIEQKNIKLILLCADWNKVYLSKIFGNKVEYKLVITDGSNTRWRRLLRRILRKIGISYLGQAKSAVYDADLLFCPFSAVNYKVDGIPAVSTINDIQHEFYPQFFTPEELQHRRNFYKSIVENATKIICISDYTKKTFCEIYGFDEEQAKTIYIAIQERFHDEDRSILERLDIEPDKYIVFPANFWEHKNHKLLLNAFGIYGASNADGKLVLTGNVLGQEEDYNKAIGAMGLKGRVVIAGYLSEEELCAIMKNAKGLIYPSLFEGFGIPIVEAMQMNKLIASSNLTSLPEIGCDSIYYFNPKKPDEIVKGIEFLFRSAMNSEIEKDYASQLEKYTISTMAKEYLEVFRQAIEDEADEKKGIRATGVYGDGWSQKKVAFHVIKHKGNVLHVLFTVPVHLPAKTRIYIKAGNVKYKYEYNREEINEIVEVIREDCEDIQIILTSTWNPQRIMNSEDDRELGIMIENMELVTCEGAEQINII